MMDNFRPWTINSVDYSFKIRVIAAVEPKWVQT